MKKLFTILTMLFVLFSCGNSQNSSEKILRINASAEGNTLDVNLLTDNTGVLLHELLSVGLTKYDPNTKKYEPALAESYTVSDDGLVWTFKLRENLKWSDGTDLTVEDFKFSWLRALNPEVASEYAYMLYPIKNAEEYNSGKVSADEVGIKVLDSKTLEVTLHSPTTYFDSLVAFVTYLPVSKAALEKFGDQYSLEADTQIYSGPFKITSWDHNSSMTLEKNENYYDKDGVKFDKVLVSFISDSGASLNAYKNDELDVVLLTTEQAQEFKDSTELQKVDKALVWYIEYNVNNDFLKNVKIRQAISQAVNKEEIVETVFNGVNTAAYSLTPKGVGMNGVSKDFVEEMNGGFVAKFNPENAKKLFEEGLKELGLESAPKISIILNDSGSNKKIGEAIQEYLRVNLGLEIEIELMTFKERLQRMKSKKVIGS